MKLERNVKVFMTTFRTLPTSGQKAILAQMLKMRKWRKDLIDIAIAELRSKEDSRLFRDFLAEIKK